MCAYLLVIEPVSSTAGSTRVAGFGADALAGLLTPLLVGLLALWVVAPLALGMIVFARRSTG